MNNLIDGRALAKVHEELLAEKIKQLVKKPKVVSILIGGDPASVLYTNLKQKKAEELGIEFEQVRFLVHDNFNEVAEKIRELNHTSEVSGIMMQLPIPEEFLKGQDWTELPHLIDPEKDVDGLVPGSPYLSATARAVISILEDENISVKGKKVVVVGKSELVGKPVADELRKMGAEVEVVDRKTADPAQICSTADILVSAAGSPKLVKDDWVKEGAVVIDVGTSELDGKIVGDVDFEEVAPKASRITPSPGGVGPMTVISLMENVAKSITNSKL